MTNPVYYDPEHLSAEQLDTLLAMGWYRMHQSIFTTNYIYIDDKTLRVFWLRYPVQAMQLSKKHEKLLKQNVGFEIINKRLTITAELEDLYSLYKTAIAFEPAPSIAEWLHGNEQNKTIYDTHLFEIRDDGRLIAAGIYDQGKNSIAGIMNFYHPKYKKFSLGKYLVLLKAQYAKASQRKWYYPGYITYGYPAFDYKLFLGEQNTEVLLPELNGWYRYNEKLVNACSSINAS